MTSKKQFLSAKNKKGRLEFAKAHINWSVQKWKTVLFSDESKYKLKSSYGIRRVRRRKVERLSPKYCKGTIKHGGGGNVKDCGCFSDQGIGLIHRVNAIMDRFMYRDIWNDVMLPYANEEIPFIGSFQQNNDPKHTSKVYKTWLQSNKIQVLYWPAQSPDLNPIENLWEFDNMKINRENFRNKVRQFSRLISRRYYILGRNIGRHHKTFISSMHKRCACVIQNKGFATK